MEKLFEYASEYAKGYADVGYDEDQIASVRDAFIDGVKWARQNPEYKPELVEYYEEDQTGQPCSLCPFHKIPYAQSCSALFEKHFGKSCATFAVRFEHIADVSKKVDDL